MDDVLGLVHTGKAEEPQHMNAQEKTKKEQPFLNATFRGELPGMGPLTINLDIDAKTN